MITESSVYWITRMDYIRGVCIGLLALSTVLGGVSAFAGIDSDYEEVSGRLWQVFKVSILVVIVSTAGVVFIPTTQELVLIKVIPAVSNSEFVTKQLPTEIKAIYEAGKQSLLRNLKGEQRGQK